MADWRTEERALQSAVETLNQTIPDNRALTKDLAHNSGGGEVRIHGLDGKIRDSDTVPPARDPFPPRDTKH